MGFETLAFVALSAIGAASQASAARKESKAIAAEGSLAMANKAIEVKRKAAAAKSSFLNSGLTLEGTPMGAIMGIYNTGEQDISQIGNVYNAKSKSIISSSRSKMITDIATSVAGASLGGLDGLSNFGTDVGAGFSSMENPFDIGNFDLGYSASGSFRAAQSSLDATNKALGGNAFN